MTGLVCLKLMKCFFDVFDHGMLENCGLLNQINYITLKIMRIDLFNER